MNNLAKAKLSFAAMAMSAMLEGMAEVLAPDVPEEEMDDLLQAAEETFVELLLQSAKRTSQ